MVESAEAATSTPFLQLDGVVKSYGPVTALGPVTLALDGRCTVILGPNGAGKSTLLRLLLGLARPQAGTLRIAGDAVGPGHVDARRRIGYAPQGQALFPGMTGWDAVAYAGRLSGLPTTASLQRAHQVLDYVGLDEERYRSASTYSAGMRQRLKLAQALVHDPKVLILDEPTEAVDPQSRRAILDLLRDLSSNHGVRILLSTHLLSDAEEVADEVVVLNKGQVVSHGPLGQLRKPGTDGLVVRVNRDPERLLERFTGHGLQAKLEGHAITVRGAAAADVFRHAQAEGLTVRHLAPVEVTLQQAFHEAVTGVQHG